MFSKNAKDDSQTLGAPSIINANLAISGDLVSDGDIQLDGSVEGDVRTRRLTVGDKGTVNGAVVAEYVRVCGTVRGQIQAREVSIARSARVAGDIIHETLSIESGAHVEGHCRRAEGGFDDGALPLKLVADNAGELHD